MPKKSSPSTPLMDEADHERAEHGSHNGLHLHDRRELIAEYTGRKLSEALKMASSTCAVPLSVLRPP